MPFIMGSTTPIDGVRRDGCVNGVAAVRKNLRASLRGERAFRRDNSALRDDHRAALRTIL